MLQTALIALGSLITLGTAATLLYKAGAGSKAAELVQKAPDVLSLVKPGASEGLRGAAVLGHHIELAAKRELNGDALQAFLQFLSTGPTPGAVLSYAETNFGSRFVKDIEDDLPELAADELAVFGDHLPTVVRDFVAKLLPGIAHQQAQQQLTAAQVSADLAKLAGAKAA